MGGRPPNGCCAHDTVVHQPWTAMYHLRIYPCLRTGFFELHIRRNLLGLHLAKPHLQMRIRFALSPLFMPCSSCSLKRNNCSDRFRIRCTVAREAPVRAAKRRLDSRGFRRMARLTAPTRPWDTRGEEHVPQLPIMSPGLRSLPPQKSLASGIHSPSQFSAKGASRSTRNTLPEVQLESVDPLLCTPSHWQISQAFK